MPSVVRLPTDFLCKSASQDPELFSAISVQAAESFSEAVLHRSVEKIFTSIDFLALEFASAFKVSLIVSFSSRTAVAPDMGRARVLEHQFVVRCFSNQCGRSLL